MGGGRGDKGRGNGVVCILLPALIKNKLCSLHVSTSDFRLLKV